MLGKIHTCAKGIRHTSLALRECDMTPGLVLDKLNFDLSASCFLVGLWLIVVVVIIAGRVDCVVVVDKRVVCDGWLSADKSRMGVNGVRAWLVHVDGALPLSHCRGSWILGVHAEHDDEESGKDDDEEAVKDDVDTYGDEQRAKKETGRGERLGLGQKRTVFRGR